MENTFDLVLVKIKIFVKIIDGANIFISFDEKGQTSKNNIFSVIS